MVELPMHVVWSGLRAFDLDRPRLRISLYRTVLTEGMHDDLCRLLTTDLLLALWPTLHTLIGRAVRDTWEDAFPEIHGSLGAPLFDAPVTKHPVIAAPQPPVPAGPPHPTTGS